jgi:hypothetical protein
MTVIHLYLGIVMNMVTRPRLVLLLTYISRESSLGSNQDMSQEQNLNEKHKTDRNQEAGPSSQPWIPAK